MRPKWTIDGDGREHDGLGDVEQKVRQVLQSQAERIEPSDDAFLRITEAVATQTPTGWRRLFRPGLAGAGGPAWSPLAFVSAVVAVAFGLTVTFLPPDDANIAAIGPSAPSISGAANGSDGVDVDGIELPTPDDVTADPGSTLSGLRSDDDLLDSADRDAGSDLRSDESRAATPSTLPDSNGYAPVRTTSSDAVTSLIDRLGLNRSGRVDLGQFEQRIESDRITLLGVDGEVEVARVDLDRVEDAFTVARISADTIDMTLADGGGASNATGDDESGPDGGLGARFGQSVVVSIDADESVQSVVVEVIAATNGRPLARTERSTNSTTANAWSFETSLSFTGADRGWILATAYASDGEVVGVDGRPIEFTGAPDTSNYTVVGLRPNDVDGGLVVRDAPAGDRVGVLSFGTSGIRRVSVPAEMVDDVTWWSITATDGTEGWVAAEYLMAVPELSSVELQRWARSVLSGQPASSAPLTAAGQSELFGDRLTMGNGLRPSAAQNRFAPNRLLTAFAWSSVRNLPQVGSVSFADFYDVTRWQVDGLSVGVDSGDAPIRRANLTRFGALPSFVVPIADGVDSVGSDTDGSAGDVGGPDANPVDPDSGDRADQGQVEGTANRADAGGGVLRQVRFHIADGALPGEPTLPIIVGITVEEVDLGATDPDTELHGGDESQIDDSEGDPATGDNDDTVSGDGASGDGDTEDGDDSQTGDGQSNGGSNPDDSTNSVDGSSPVEP